MAICTLPLKPGDEVLHGQGIGNCFDVEVKLRGRGSASMLECNSLRPFSNSSRKMAWIPRFMKSTYRDILGNKEEEFTSNYFLFGAFY